MMKDNKVLFFTPAQSIQKSYLRQPIEHDAVEKFRHQLSTQVSDLDFRQSERSIA